MKSVRLRSLLKRMFSFITAICLLGVVTAWPGQTTPPAPPPPPPPFGLEPVIFPPNAPVPPHPTSWLPQPESWPFQDKSVVCRYGYPIPPPHPPRFPVYPWDPKPEFPEIQRHDSDSIWMFSFITAICLLGAVTAWWGQKTTPPPPPPPPPFTPFPAIYPHEIPILKPLLQQQSLIPDPFATWPWDHPAPSPPQPAHWPFVEVVPTPPENLFPYPPFTGSPSPIGYPWDPKPEILPNPY